MEVGEMLQPRDQEAHTGQVQAGGVRDYLPDPGAESRLAAPLSPG